MRAAKKSGSRFIAFIDDNIGVDWQYFSELMKHAAVMVGNSSAGVREAPFLGVPSLDVGTRQNRRANGPSITACSATDSGVIDGFLKATWGQRTATDTTFGAGRAAAGGAADARARGVGDASATVSATARGGKGGAVSAMLSLFIQVNLKKMVINKRMNRMAIAQWTIR